MRISLSVIIGLVSLTSTIFGQDDIKFPFKSGVIKYGATGFAIGKSIVYFENFGKTLCEDFSGTVWDQNIETRTIVKDEMIYTLDMKEKTFTVVELNIAGMKLYEEFYFDEKRFKEKGFTFEGEEVVLTKKCKIYSKNKDFLLRVWVWKGLIIKKEDDLLGGSVVYATSIENTAPEAKIFEIPGNFTEQ